MTDGGGAPWPQLVVHIDRAAAEATEEGLFAAGALSVTFLDEEDRPVLEPAPGEVRLWARLSVVALFAQGSEPALIRRAVASQLGDELAASADLSLVPDQAWERAWMDQFSPMRFGERLWICPTHCDPPEADAVNLRLDPGLAFGSGTHATTALCLEWLDGAHLANTDVLDFGCGSGVLGIAALLLGAAKVAATDIDPQALQATRENALLNGVSDRLRLASADELVNNKYDILVANILYQPLQALKPTFCTLLKPNGCLVVSGLLAEQADALVAHYADVIRLDERAEQDGWVRLSGQRI